MKKYLSVFMLHARSTLYKIILLCIAMMTAEFYLFHRQLNYVFTSDYSDNIMRRGLGLVFTYSKIPFVFLAAFLFITMLLTLNGFEFKEKISYTIRRLSITEKQFFLIHGFYNSMVYLLFLAIQLITIFLLSIYYFKTVPENYYSNQTLFVIFYANDFLHSLLPLEETIRAVRNILLIFALGYASAFQSYCQRRKRKQGIIIVLTFFSILNFKSYLGSFTGDIFLISASVTALGVMAYDLIRKGDTYEI